VFEVVGTDLRISLRDVAVLAADSSKLPEGETPGLDETCLYRRPNEVNVPNARISPKSRSTPIPAGSRW
jgi:hypothetical protein